MRTADYKEPRTSHRDCDYICTTLALNTVKSIQTKDTLGMGHLSLVERLSSSQRFSFKPIGKSLKTDGLILP